MLGYTTGMRAALAIRALIYAVAASLLIYAAYLGAGYLLAHHSGDSVPSDVTVTSSSPAPSERPTPSPSSPRTYHVSADQPRAIDIPAITVSGFIQRVDEDKNGHMATPTNISFAGWYVKSALPGQTGVSIINGHVSGRYSDGIFKNLQQLHQGDVIRIQMGDLSWLAYRVTDTTVYKASNKTVLLRPRTGAISELHLVTCGGRYNKVNQSYNERVLISAVLLGS